MSNNTKYWIWLTLALGYSSPKIEKIYKQYNNLKEFYNLDDFEMILTGVLTSQDITKLRKTSIKEAEKIINRCNELKYNIITLDSEKYPKDLKNIYSPPTVLYVAGDMSNLDNMLSIAVVGTRKATLYGMKSAYDISYNLSKHNTIIVSGGALGVDCSAHNGALQAKGKTICVLGCGINYNYLSDNKEMRNNITYNGAVISEYPPDTQPRPYYFPARNRIIAGLSKGVLIIEAGLKSGSLITANLALEQGKDVFAVMANINSITSFGSNKLIKEGAVPVTTYKDIMEYYFPSYDFKNAEEHISKNEEIIKIPIKNEKIPYKREINNIEAKNIEANNIKNEKIVENKSETLKHKENLNLSELLNKVYYKVTVTPIHIDDLSDNCKLPVFKVLQAITELEIMGLIKCLKGRYYKIN